MQLKYQHEKLKSEIKLFHYLNSTALTPYSLPKTPLINCLRNPNIQQELREQFQCFAEKITQNTFDEHMKTLNKRQLNYQKQINQTIEQFWNIDKSLHVRHQVNTFARKAIDYRLSNIHERFICIYDHKIRILQNQSSNHL